MALGAIKFHDRTFDDRTNESGGMVDPGLVPGISVAWPSSVHASGRGWRRRHALSAELKGNTSSYSHSIVSSLPAKVIIAVSVSALRTQ